MIYLFVEKIYENKVNISLSNKQFKKKQIMQRLLSRTIKLAV